MKNFDFKDDLFAKILAALLLLGWLFCGCQKEAPPSQIIGKWEVIGDQPFNWQIEVTDQTTCRRLPQFFGKPECFDSHINGDTLFVAADTAWLWQFSFKSENVALVKNLKNNGGNPLEFVVLKK